MNDPSMDTYDINFLFAIRTRTIRGIRKDFEVMFPNEDTIPNLLICQELRAVPRNGASHEDIFSPSVDSQRTAVHQFRNLLQARDQILDWEEETEQSAYLQGPQHTQNIPF